MPSPTVTRTLRSVLAVLALAAGGHGTSAQNSAPTSPAQPYNEGASPRGTTPPSPSTGTTGPSGNLSESLSRTEGVITPRPMDGGIVTAPPVSDTGTTPVIRPPGEPGGNPNVQPK